ncbi:putative RNA polymerase sigma factor rpoD [Candidatus Carsonella ruddii PV]|uniref:Putative RNA polymerase sigma factor rpoD n=1 Tax=Carsonella ruddii (strain PV) TaxID=387662 RepID=Q05FT1_CARRP|nr:sigma factor-like helix-turn-helix DNA-binding protein [Candidatus Carsonella ruddii]BAF35090.1 putative RNA polymerase sigma factor rpoD [Candidatus Carsonella ruddii PV]
MILKIKLKNKNYKNIKNIFNKFCFKKKKKKFFLKIINTKNLFNKITILRKILLKYIFRIKIFRFFFKKINCFFFFLNFIYKNTIFFKKRFKINFKILKIIKKNFLKKKIFFNCFSIFNNKINYFLNKNYFIKMLIFIIYKIKISIIKKNLIAFKKKIKKYKNLITKEEQRENYLIFKNLIFNYNFCENKFHINFNWKIKNKIIKNKLKKNIIVLKNNCYENIKIYNEPKKTLFIREYDNRNLNNLIRLIILELPKKEQIIIRLRFGIGFPKSYTLEEIGLMYYLTKERIRQIELNVLFKLRHPTRSEVLKPYIKLLNTEE